MLNLIYFQNTEPTPSTSSQESQPSRSQPLRFDNLPEEVVEPDQEELNQPPPVSQEPSTSRPCMC